ncbi:MAG: dihydroorotate dehydrogenase electron transfer subunit [Lachnospiraceae bacterium]|nr:dihydroorotate dehydrogenase electron transfer subunit [Lachnospiraceae bacterium]
MTDRKKVLARVISQNKLSEGIYDLWLEFGDDAFDFNAVIPGQFANLYTKDPSKLLPRPISICEVDADKKALRFVYRVVGSGTLFFSTLKENDTLPVLAPLGNGYDYALKNESDKDVHVAIGGGIGIPPMLELCKKISQSGKRPVAVLGYRDNDLFLKNEFEKYADVYISTDDGSVGTHGTVIDALKESGVKADVLYSCGPIPMLKGVKGYALEADIAAYISLEERMACGIGACLGCVCKTTEVDDHSHVNNARVCKDGPVFECRAVEL